ncbi:hypothetical protein L9F63_008187, partial [Diploptera punctata]
VMEVADLLLTAIPITLGVTLALCCYFHKCAPSHKKASPDGIVTVSVLESLPMLPTVRFLQHQNSTLSAGPLKGYLLFTLKYNAQDTKLKVLIQSARNLPTTASDPYVWVSLLPDRNLRFKTNIKKNSQWCETFCFEVSNSKLKVNSFPLTDQFSDLFLYFSSK